MKLTPEEHKICDEYSRADEEGRIHCFECPLAIDTRFCVCKANVTEAEYKEWRGEENEGIY